MTIEEKAKAYDEAIEKFDVILNLDIVKESGTIFADDVRKILPELKESEDERIRKALMYHYRGNGCICNNYYRIDYKNILAWLEKQGEQKPAEWSEEDEKTVGNIKRIIEKYAFSQSAVDVNGDLCEKEFIDADNWLKSLKDRYTWKPSDEQMEALSKAIAFVFDSNSDVKHTLESLYSELKKL